ncbi:MULTISPECIES: putative hydro-lyase [Mycetohabitans]|uniref:putative hydro-lyase n=1 Tax=Mycetohabitans TaxID=2571159 RepID=UPI001F28975E|nr:putative hydro-lyase [Mycetohabitans sp. B3]MCF2134550.1 putative hydro-lyase [Mycetohabitans sp. B3]
MDKHTHPYEFRRAARAGLYDQPTAGYCEGYVQANLMILPHEYAADFARFCALNPRACPLLAVGEVGSWNLPTLGEDIDIRTDLPRYTVYRNGKPSNSLTDLNKVWRGDLVVFALGCSFSFDHLLLKNGLPVRHIELGGSAPVFVSNIDNHRSGPFGGKLAVSMRPFSVAQTIQAIEITSRYPQVHGAPVHFGNPLEIGITDVGQPDFPGLPAVRTGEIPVFWACGLTPQVAVMAAELPFAIGHAAGHMLITDISIETLLS